MSKKKKKYYTVWKGHHTGVFESWNDCKAQIKNFEGAQYKSFTTFDAAKEALKGNYFDFIGKNKSFASELTTEQLKKIGKPIWFLRGLVVFMSLNNLQAWFTEKDYFSFR